MPKDHLETLPPRARIGYVAKNANIKQGELSPDLVADMLWAMNLLPHDMTIDDLEDLAGEVMEKNSEVDWP